MIPDSFSMRINEAPTSKLDQNYQVKKLFVRVSAPIYSFNIRKRIFKSKLNYNSCFSFSDAIKPFPLAAKLSDMYIHALALKHPNRLRDFLRDYFFANTVARQKFQRIR